MASAVLTLQALAQGAAAGAAAAARLWGGLPPAVPLHSLSLAVGYLDSRLGLAGEQARTAALRTKGGRARRAASNGARFLFHLVGLVPAAHRLSCCFFFSSAGGEAAAQQWEPVINPLLLQATWQALEAAWVAGGSTDADALRCYVATGALAGSPATEDENASTASGLAAGDAAGQLGAYLQVQGVPAPGALQSLAGEVQEMLRSAGLPDASAAAAAAAAMLARRQPGLTLPAAQALAAALLH